MKAISDFGETVGVHTLLWFEPERIGDFSCCLKDGTTINSDWVLSGALVDLGNPEAVEWIKQRITKILGEGGIYMYREDFNIAPLSYWRGADASDRQGITENKYIQGHMELWDYILEEYPYVTIDSWHSGGIETTLRHTEERLPFTRQTSTTATRRCSRALNMRTISGTYTTAQRQTEMETMEQNTLPNMH